MNENRKFGRIPADDEKLDLVEEPTPEGPAESRTFGAELPELPVSRSRKTIKDILLVLLLSAISTFFFRSYVVNSVQVVGRSMSPTFADGDMRLLNKLAYTVSGPENGDIVVLNDPGDDGYAVKRVIAKPGDTLRLKDGKVYLNDNLLNENYLLNGVPTQALRGPEDQFYVFGQDRYFVLGDNRTNSLDSRFYGAVPKEKIVGTVEE